MTGLSQPDKSSTVERKRLTEGEYKHLLEILARFSPADRDATKKRARLPSAYADHTCGICAAIKQWSGAE